MPDDCPTDKSVDAKCPCTAQSTAPGRRTALAIILTGTASLVLGSFGVAAGFLANALGRQQKRPWLLLGSVNDTNILNVDTFQRHVLRVEQTHAWQRQRVPLDLYIKDLYPEDPVALLSTCSHLGCAVGWKAETERFECPCHGGQYDADGKVLSGPPPRPLTRLEVKIENDQCYVRLPTDASA